MAESTGWLANFLANPSVELTHPTDASVDQTLQWIRQFNLGRKRILDTHLAAVLYSHGIIRLLTSNPGDFAIFAPMQAVKP